MSDESNNLTKWALGIISTVISGVVVYYITEGISNPPSTFTSPTPQIIVVQPSPTVTEPKTVIDRGEPKTPVSFILHDRIFPEQGQLRSECIVHVNGKFVGNLNVDLANPVATISVNVPRPGLYRYTLVNKILNININGTTWVEEANADGLIYVDSGKSFFPVLESNGNSKRLYLKENN